MDEGTAAEARGGRGIWKLIVLIVVVVGLLVAVKFLPIKDYILWGLEWRNTKARWKREIPIWEKMREHGKGTKGKIAVIKLNIKVKKSEKP